MKITVMLLPSALSWSCSSMPLIPGSCTSRTRQSDSPRFPAARYSSAEAKTSVSNSADSKSIFNDSRTERSSSTIDTIGRLICSGANIETSRFWQSLRGALEGSELAEKKIYDLSNRPLLVMRLGEFISHPYQGRDRSGLHLEHDVTAMDLNGPLARRKFESDLFIQKPLGDERHDLFLAR